MIESTAVRDGSGRIIRLTVEGHDRSAPAGENLVCAAVSAMTEMARYALVEVARLPVETGAAKGRVTIALPPEAARTEAARVVLEGLVGGFARMNERYGNPIRLVERVSRQTEE